MTSSTPAAPRSPETDFSLVLGGPLFQLWRRARLTDDALALIHKRIVVLSLLCWLPLLALCAIEGRLLAGTGAVAFVRDVEVHARFLVALPLLIGAELIVHQRMLPLTRQFRERGLLAPEDLAQFDVAVASALRLRNSVSGELILALLVLVVGGLVFREYVVLDAATWYATPTANGSQFSLAGMWYGHVSLPIFQFIALRWYFRVLIWWRLLLQVSRLPLQLLATHPDGVAGLSFMSAVVAAFAPIATAHGALLAGRIANEIFYLNAKLPQFVVEIAILVGFLLLIVLGPLLVFAPQLSRIQRTARREYDALAHRYVREFDSKWLRGGAAPDEALLGSADIQSLADLGSSLDVIRTMQVAPITRRSVVTLTLATVAPMAPLLLTMMPLEELVKRLFSVLF